MINVHAQLLQKATDVWFTIVEACLQTNLKHTDEVTK